MNKPGLWLWLVMQAGMAGPAGAAGVDLNFSGALIDSQCMLDPASAALAVSLPQHPPSFFQAAGRTVPVTFDLVLKNCSSTLLNKAVQVTFSSTSTQAVGGVMLLDTEGGTGILVGLEDMTGQAISVGSAVNAGTLTQTGATGENHFRFRAYAQGPADLSAPVLGTYTATTTFAMSYQ